MSEQTQKPSLLKLDWADGATWRTASHNTLWCLIGCSIGDMGTILYFQVNEIAWPVWAIMSLAIFNGLLTSIALETFLLLRQMNPKKAFQTAIGMSLISMISMELAMNLVDVAMMGGARLSLGVLPFMWAAGFLTPLPYNYWRLKAHGKACH